MNTQMHSGNYSFNSDEPDIILDDDPLEDSDSQAKHHSESDIHLTGVVKTYLVGLKNKLDREIDGHGMPLCYVEGHFWIHPHDPYFAMQKAAKSCDVHKLQRPQTKAVSERME